MRRDVGVDGLGSTIAMVFKQEKMRVKQVVVVARGVFGFGFGFMVADCGIDWVAMVGEGRWRLIER